MTTSISPALIAALWMGLVVGTVHSVAANATPAPYAPRLVAQTNRLELRAETARARANEHPVRIDENQLAQLLQRIRYAENNGGTVHFDEPQAYRVSRALGSALLNAGPNQDLLLASFRIEGNFLSQKRYVTTARVFAEAGRLNLIFGTIDEFFSENRNRELEPLIYGERDGSGQFAYRLQSSPGLGSIAGRPDWIALDLNAGLAPQVTLPAAVTPAVPATRPQPVTTAAPAEATAPSSPPAAPPAPPLPAKSATSLPDTAPVVAGAAPADSEDELVNKLKLLRKLHGDGLITNDDYEQRKSDLLDRLMR